MGVGEMVGAVFVVVALLLLLREWRSWEADADIEHREAQILDMTRRTAAR
jgi:hypothetical protein